MIKSRYYAFTRHPRERYVGGSGNTKIIELDYKTKYHCLKRRLR